MPLFVWLLLALGQGPEALGALGLAVPSSVLLPCLPCALPWFVLLFPLTSCVSNKSILLAAN